MNVYDIASTFCPAIVRQVLAKLKASPLGLRLASGTFWSMAGATTIRILNLLAMVIVARLLGKSVFGELGIVRATIGMLGLLAGFALGLTATKHVAEFRRKDPERAGRIIGLSWAVSVATGGVMALLLFLFAPWLAEHTLDAPHLAPMLRIGAAIVLLNALTGAQTGALFGFEAFRTIAKVNLYVGIAGFPLLTLGVWMAGLRGAVSALAINLGVQWILNHFALRREAHRYGVPLRIGDCFKELPILWSFGIPAGISGIIISPVMWGTKSLLAEQPDGYAALGTVAVAETWRLVPLFLCTMIEQTNLPIMSQLYAEGNLRSFRKMLGTQFCLNGLIAIAGALVVSVLSKPIMSAYGSEFTKEHSVLILVMISTIPMQISGVVSTMNRCIGRIWWNALFNGIWAITYALGAIKLIRLGALGLAWAIVMACCLQFSVAMVYMYCLFKDDGVTPYAPRRSEETLGAEIENTRDVCAKRL